MNEVHDDGPHADSDDGRTARIVLRACPHCGPLPAMPELVRSDVNGRWQVYCGPCGSSSGSSRTPAQAAASWNSRAPGPAEMPTSSAAVTELAVILSNMLADLTPSNERPRYGFASPERQAQAYDTAHLITACMNGRAQRDADIHRRIEALIALDRTTDGLSTDLSIPEQTDAPVHARRTR